MIRRAKSLGLCAEFNNKKLNPECHKVLKRIIALPFLPADRIIEGLDSVQILAYELGRRQSTTEKWKNFFEYYRKEWIQIVKPENFTVCGVRFRTNNFLERWHRDLNEYLCAKPTVKNFIGNACKFFRKYI